LILSKIGKISLSLLEDLEIPEESVDKGGSRKDSKRPDNRRRNDRPNNRNRNDKPRDEKPSNDSTKRKRVSFEDDFEKGI